MTTELTNDMLSSLLKEIIPALIQVESAGDDNAHNKAENACGCLQIRDIYLHDVNRIQSLRGPLHGHYDYGDRWNRLKSEMMATIYLTHYGKIERVNPNSKRDWLLKLAKIHHGGPDGHKKQATEKYGKSVMNIIKKGLISVK